MLPKVLSLKSNLADSPKLDRIYVIRVDCWERADSVLAQLSKAEKAPEKSQAWINQSPTALDKGFTEAYRIEAEDDLEPIRTERRYLKLVAVLP